MTYVNLWETWQLYYVVSRGYPGIHVQIMKKVFSMKLKWKSCLTAALLLVFLSGCRTYPDEIGSFRFPILDGDIQEGQDAFVRLECNQCHVVDGVQLPAFSGPRPVTVELGGEMYFAKTYGDLHHQS